jgi:hypothetical protein
VIVVLDPTLPVCVSTSEAVFAFTGYPQIVHLANLLLRTPEARPPVASYALVIVMLPLPQFLQVNVNEKDAAPIMSSS